MARPHAALAASFLLFVSGCRTGDAATASTTPAPDLAAAADWRMVDDDPRSIRSTTDALHRARDRYDALTPAAQARVRAATRSLAVNCPWNRSSLQLPLALSLEADKVRGEGLDADQREAWRQLRSGLALHVETLDRMVGSDWPMPGVTDNLDQLHAPALQSRTDLLQDPHPLASTHQLLLQIDVLVPAFTTTTLATLNEARATLDADHPDAWPLSDALVGWSAALEQLRPHFTDPHDQRILAEMLAELELYQSKSC